MAALPQLPRHTLLVLGDGPERAALRDLAERLGVADRVRLLGSQPHDRLSLYYGAADAMVLASSREGWANVLLESMACGTPWWPAPPGAAAKRCGPRGRPGDGRDHPEAIAASVRQLLDAPPSRAATRAYAEGFGWDETTAGQVSLFRKVLA
ncbi:glycosyltransferase [Pseudoroseomonas wenyumeiae]